METQELASLAASEDPPGNGIRQTGEDDCRPFGAPVNERLMLRGFVMNLRTLLAGASFLGVLAAGAALPASAATLSAQFFERPNFGTPYLPTGSGDFSTCCTSGVGAATLPVIQLGSGLSSGMPVTTLTSGSDAVVDQTASGGIEWWTPGDDHITSDGSGTFKLGQLNNMFPPASSGQSDTDAFETAILSGTLIGNGGDAKITVGSDDDAFVYVDGAYVGGNPGVHGTEFTTINLGSLTGSHSLEVFYADRSVVGANLEISVAGAAIPEPAAWAMMLLGVGMVGAGLRVARSKDGATAAV